MSPPVNPLFVLPDVPPMRAGSSGRELIALSTETPEVSKPADAGPVPVKSISKSIGSDISRSRGPPIMADGSISDMSDAVPGSWLWPSPALAVGVPWYSDMPDGSVVLRVLSQRGGQATATPARIDDAALDPDRTARLRSGCATDLDAAVWRGGGHTRVYVTGRAEGGANAVDGNGMQQCM